jgi:ATP-dependent protease ClpP protease subunit
MTKLASILLAVSVAFGSAFYSADIYRKLYPVRPNVCETRWEDEIGSTFVEKVRGDLGKAKDAKCKKLTIRLLSPGGSVILTFEAVRLMTQAKKEGLVLEIHGDTLVASGATFVLAAGSRGYRFIDRNAVYFIHPPRRGGMFTEPKCVGLKDAPKDEDEGIDNVIVIQMAKWYQKLSGKSYEEALSWVKCGTWASGSKVAIVRGLADREE